MGGRHLHTLLRSTLTKYDLIMRVGLLLELSQVLLSPKNDVEKLIYDLFAIVTKGAKLDTIINESNLVSHAKRLTFNHQGDRNIWESLLAQGEGDDWEAIKAALQAK